MINKLKTKGKYFFIVYQAIFLFFFLIIMLCKLKPNEYLSIEPKKYNIFQYASIYYNIDYAPPLLFGLVILYFISFFFRNYYLDTYIQKKVQALVCINNFKFVNSILFDRN